MSEVARLAEGLIAAISAKDYDKAQELCEELELVAEEASCLQQISVESLLSTHIPEFYTVYLLVLLIQGNLNEAKYVWKRAPMSFRGYEVSLEEEMSSSSSAMPTIMPAVWQVGKALWQQDIATALTLLLQPSTPWSSIPQLQTLSAELTTTILRAYLELVLKSYRSCTLSHVASLLQIPEAQLTTLLPNVNWSLLGNGQLQANYEVEFKTQDQILIEDVQRNIESMKRVGEYVANFERKPLKADLSSNSTTTSTSKPKA